MAHSQATVYQVLVGKVVKVMALVTVVMDRLLDVTWLRGHPATSLPE